MSRWPQPRSSEQLANYAADLEAVKAAIPRGRSEISAAFESG